MIEQALRDYLREKRKVRDRIGNCIYAGRLPRSAPKLAATIQELPTGSHEYHLVAEATERKADVQIDIWGKRGTQATDVSDVGELIRLAVSGYRGLMGATVYVEGCTIERSGRMPPGSPKDASDEWIHRWSMDLAITFHQAAPTFT